MKKIFDIVLIVLGCTSTVILVFTSYKSVDLLSRFLFWISFTVSVLIIIYSGINGILQSAIIKNLAKHKPFQLTEKEKNELKVAIAKLVKKETENVQIKPEIQFLSFSGQTPDAMDFQEFIRSELEANGRKTKNNLNLGLTSAGFDGNPWNGIVINVNDAENPPLLAQELFDILNKLKIKTIGQQSQGYGDNHVVIYSNKPCYFNSKKKD